MKIKYKKALLLTLLSSLGIGIMAISLTLPGAKSDIANKDIDALNEQQNLILEEEATPMPSATSTPAPTQILLPTTTPAPTPLPVYSLEDSGYPNINTLMKAYYEAKLYCDVELLEGLLSDPSELPPLEQLKEDIMYVEEYQAIKCYVKKSYIKGAYIVFVYHEIKFLNIETPAPAFDRFYIITDAKDNLKIFSGTFDDITKNYYYKRIEDADVQALIKETNEKSEAAREKDELLRIFWEN